MLFRCLLLLSLLFQISARAESQTDIFDMGDLYFQSLGAEVSIPIRTVSALAQDNRGFIWIGTQKGLVRYDGYQFRRYQFDSEDKHSLSGNFISALWLAPNGNLWIGTRNDGLSMFNPSTESFTQYRHIPEQANSLSNNYIGAIIGNKDGSIWVGTNKGLDKLNPLNGEFQHYSNSSLAEQSIKNKQVRALLYDRQGKLYIGTRGGLNLLDSANKTFSPVYSNENNPESLAQQTINKLLLAKDGKVWIATRDSGAAWIELDGSFHRVKVDPSQKGALNHAYIRDMVQVSEDKIWMATFGGGINIVDLKTGQIVSIIQHDISIPSSINLNTMAAIFQDQSGLVWIGTWGSGLNLYSPKSEAFRTLHHSPDNKQGNRLSHADILSILEAANGDIWVGTRGNGIDVFRPGTGMIKSFRVNKNDSTALQEGSISALIQSPDGNIWIGTRRSGLFLYQPESNDFKQYTHQQGLYNSSIKRLLADTAGSVWIGTTAGLEKFTPALETFERILPSHSDQIEAIEQVNGMVLLNQNEIWVGASNGLFRFHTESKHFSQFIPDKKLSSSISHASVVGLFLGQQNKIWASTHQGVDRLVITDNLSPEFESINQLLGMTPQSISSNLLQDHQGNIWGSNTVINTNQWLSRKLTKSDGVDIGASWNGSYEKTRNGTLLFGGSKGLLMINPQIFEDWSYKPPIVISKLIVNGITRPVGKLKQIELRADAKNFSIEFSALDFSDPKNNHYTYKLEGYDPQWNSTSATNRTASYTNLSPGNYQLNIRGTNRLGLWSDKSVSLSITILPHWYQTLWFKFIVLIASLICLYLIYSLRVRQLNQRQKELTLQVSKQTIELRRSNKSISTLSDIGNEISSTLDLDKILNTVYFHVNQLMDANVFCIGFYDDNNEEIIFKLTMERNIQLAEYSVSMEEENRLAVWCVKNNKPIIINDFERDKPHYFGDIPSVAPQAGEETASVIYWPLNVGGRIIGTISVQSFNQNAYTQHHQDIIKTLASTTAIAMDNANAYRKAQQASKTKSVFLANMSHEIRTPMHGILGMTQLMIKTNLDNEQKEFVNNIEISSKALLTIINDILDFSKVEAGKIILEKKPFGLSELFIKLSATTKLLAESKGLNLVYKISPNTPADFIGDENRINQILLNLCSNAIKFTDFGDIKIRISVVKERINSVILQIDVIDQGIGISSDVLPNLFSSFSQADASTTRKYGGTGLGLAISRKLAQKMSGDILVKSQQGIGSCFTLTIELQKYNVFFENNLDALQMKRRCQLLIVDDNVNSDSAIYKNLSRLNIEILTCINEQEIYNLIESSTQKIDFLLYNLDSLQESKLPNINMLIDKLYLNPKNIILYSEKTPQQNLKHLSGFDIEINNVMQTPLSLIKLQGFFSERLCDLGNKSDINSQLPFNSIKILLAEDNKINQIIAKKLLTERGAIVDIVENGKKAVTQVENKQYDLVLMDIQMPEMDGTEATQLIRNNPNNKFLPIIAMTANVLEKDIQNYKEIGIDEHISKPIDTKDLVSKISKYIKNN